MSGALTPQPRVLLIDNYDSFTHNLYQALGELGAAVQVVRNDALDLAGVRATQSTHIVISPGPGHPSNPRDFGVCGAVIDGLPELPILGVCLGHQGIADRLGGRVVRAPEIVHGKVHAVQHDGQGVFAGLPAPLPVMRYHSWIVEEASLPEALEITARTQDGLIMGLRHRTRPLVGVQFHPESIGTPDGPDLLGNFLRLQGAAR
jgi:anthranilate synthase/aminodeoxychorismate synthase-like glutamine amidotransferase